MAIIVHHLESSRYRPSTLFANFQSCDPAYAMTFSWLTIDQTLDKIQTEFMRIYNMHSALQVATDPLAVGRARRIIRGENIQTTAEQVGAARIEGGTSVGKEPCDYRWKSHSSRDR